MGQRKPKERYKATFGARGYTVTVFERVPGGNLHVRWWDPSAPTTRKKGGAGNWRVRSLGHTDRDTAEDEAKLVMADLLTATESERTGRVTLRELFARYEGDVSAHKTGQQPREDRRRIELWTLYLGGDIEAGALTHTRITAFVRDRRAGRVKLPPRKGGQARQLKKRPAETTIGADIVFLQSVLNWAVRERLIQENPLRGFQRPETARPKRPVATWNRFLRVYRYADRADAQKLFRPFLMLVQELGWRVSAICQLRASDVDRQASEEAPHGRVRKRAEFDKEGVEQWVPLSAEGRRAVDRLLRRRPAIGEAWLFPAPRGSRKKQAQRRKKPWSRWHARDLLERAERFAGVQRQEGGQFHPYRRKWATERKHLPAQDVAYVGGWKDLRSLEGAYQQVDAETVLAVVSEPRKLKSAITPAITRGEEQRNGPARKAQARP